MDDLIKMLIEKVNLDEATAQQAAEEVFSFFKERLPEPVAAQLDALLAGGQLDDAAGGLMDKFKGLLGG